MREDRLIAWLRRQIRRQGPDLLGDDGALLPGPLAGGLVATVDTQIEGRHFFPGLDPAVLARRLLAVNLSDLAAMGARPRWALLSLVTPRGSSGNDGFDHRRFFRAFLAACQPFGLVLAGGDLASADHLQATLTLLGEPWGRPLRRAGASPGERLYVGGPLGLSALGHRLLAARRGDARRGDARRAGADPLAGLPARLIAAGRSAIDRHLRPRPQLELGERLARDFTAGAALDVSDGLLRDLHRLARASGVALRVELDALPMPPAAQRLAARLGWDWRELAAAGGEDYVLAFTLPAAATPPEGAVAIGRVRRGPARLEDEQGRPLAPAGFDHLEGTAPWG